jgi:hypothetical protein
MTGARVLALAICLTLQCAIPMQDARAEDRGQAGSASTRPMHYELPAQSLADALDAFGRMTRILIIAHTPMLADRTSGPVNGVYPAQDALQLLLAGTGLQASFSGEDEVVIELTPPVMQRSLSDTPKPLAINASAIDGVMVGGDYRAYVAMIQTRLTEALCRTPLARPGDYRLMAQLRIDDMGAVVQSKIGESTGMPQRDAAIAQAISTLVFDSPPPPGFPEPVTILLRPPGSGVDTDCSQFGG